MKQDNHAIFNKCYCILANVIKQWRIVICVVAICGVGFDILKTISYHLQYQATTNVYIDSKEMSFAEGGVTSSYAKTLDYILDTKVVSEYVQEQMKDSYYPYICTVSQKENTNILTISVVSDTKQSSFYTLKNILNWYNANHLKYELEYEMQRIEDISFQDAPVVANSHFSNLKKGAVAGGVLIIVILAFINFMKSTVTSPKEIEAHIDSRLFAKIPRERKPISKTFWKKNRLPILISSMKTSFAYKEAIKKLRHRLEESSEKHNYKTVVVTSCSENEGKSSIGVNLALSLAMKKHKVLIVDTDFRKPSIHKILNIKSKKYLNDYLDDKAAWMNLIVHASKYNVDTLICKKDLELAEAYCENDKFASLLEEAKQLYDYIIVDTSPAGYLNDALKVNKHCDCSLLVVKQNLASYNQINNTIARLSSIKNNLLGIVYNASLYQLHDKKMGVGSKYGYDRYYSRNRRA